MTDCFNLRIKNEGQESIILHLCLMFFLQAPKGYLLGLIVSAIFQNKYFVTFGTYISHTTDV